MLCIMQCVSNSRLAGSFYRVTKGVSEEISCLAEVMAGTRQGIERETEKTYRREINHLYSGSLCKQIFPIIYV